MCCYRKGEKGSTPCPVKISLTPKKGNKRQLEVEVEGIHNHPNDEVNSEDDPRPPVQLSKRDEEILSLLGVLDKSVHRPPKRVGFVKTVEVVVTSSPTRNDKRKRIPARAVSTGKKVAIHELSSDDDGDVDEEEAPSAKRQRPNRKAPQLGIPIIKPSPDPSSDDDAPKPNPSSSPKSKPKPSSSSHPSGVPKLTLHDFLFLVNPTFPALYEKKISEKGQIDPNDARGLLEVEDPKIQLLLLTDHVKINTWHAGKIAEALEKWRKGTLDVESG